MSASGRVKRMLGAVSLVVVGCAAGEEQGAEGAGCVPDELMACPCLDGTTAMQACLPTGDAFGPCQCLAAPGTGGTLTGTGGFISSGGSISSGGYAGTGGLVVTGGMSGGGTAGVAGAGGDVIGGMPGDVDGGIGGSSTGGIGGIGGSPTGGTGGIGGSPTGGTGGIGGSPTGGTGGVGGSPTGGTGGVGGSTGGTGGGGTGGAPSTSECLDGITNYTTDGPFSFTTRRVGQVNFWVPNVPAGCKVPITHLANGTGASCGTYSAILQHMASHGFLTTCYESTATGQGTQCLTAIETALNEYPDLADSKVGSTGHSQGGGGAIMCVYRTEQAHGSAITIVGHAMEPAHGYGDAPSNYATLYGQIRSPIFMFNGSNDSLVSATWVGQGFTALSDSVEAYWYEAIGAAHIPIPTRWTEESTVAWFRWKLLGDQQACQYFKNMPNSSDWNLRDSQAETNCQ